MAASGHLRLKPVNYLLFDTLLKVYLYVFFMMDSRVIREGKKPFCQTDLIFLVTVE